MKKRRNLRKIYVHNYVVLAQAQLEKEAQETEHLAQIEEQERRDHELALRLASETNSGVEDMTPSLKRYMFCGRCKQDHLGLSNFCVCAVPSCRMV